MLAPGSKAMHPQPASPCSGAGNLHKNGADLDPVAVKTGGIRHGVVDNGTLVNPGKFHLTPIIIHRRLKRKAF